MDLGGQARPRTRLGLHSILYLLPVLIALVLNSVATISFWQFAVLLGVALVTAVVANYVLVYAPAVTFRNRELTSFLNHHLELLVHDYRRRTGVDCEVRANVMIPQHSRTVSHRGGLDVRVEKEEFLQIAYHSEGYAQIEQNREWEFAQGCCGKAYDTNEQVAAERKTEGEEWGQAWGTTPEQDQATAHLNSVLSTPIYKPTDQQRENPIAVLNLDSEAAAERTGFHDDAKQDLVVEEYAAEIGTLV